MIAPDFPGPWSRPAPSEGWLSIVVVFAGGSVGLIAMVGVCVVMWGGR